MTDKVKHNKNIKLQHAGGIAMCRKNEDFASGYKKVSKIKIILFYI